MMNKLGFLRLPWKLAPAAFAAASLVVPSVVLAADSSNLVAKVSDLDADGFEDVALLISKADNGLEVRIHSSMSGQSLGILPVSSDISPLELLSLNNGQTLALVSVDANGARQAQLFDLPSGATRPALSYAPNHSAEQAFALFDTNGNGHDEVVVVGRDLDTGSVFAQVVDSGSQQSLASIKFPKNYFPFAAGLVEDQSGNGIAEIFVAGRSPLDGRILAQVRDSISGQLVSTVKYPKDYAPFSASVLSDSNMSGVPELAVLATRESDGQIRLTRREIDTGAKLPVIKFAREYVLQAATSVQASAANYMAVIGSDPADDRPKLQLRNTENGVLQLALSTARNIVPFALFPLGSAPDSADRVLVVGRRAADGLFFQVFQVSDGLRLAKGLFEDGFVSMPERADSPNLPPILLGNRVLPESAQLGADFTLRADLSDPDGDAVESVQLRYRLRDIDADWIVLDMPEKVDVPARYEVDITPSAVGDYEFQFRAGDADRPTASAGWVSRGHFSVLDDTNQSNQPPSQPQLSAPAEGASEVLVDVVLSWLASSDPDADAIEYEVYIDTVADPSAAVPLLTTSTSVSAGTLVHEQTYYWQVVATDGNGAEAASVVRSFTVGADQNPPPNTFDAGRFDESNFE